MNCISEETAMLYAESELAAEEIPAVDDHLAVCAACRELVGLLRAESAALTTVLREDVPDRRVRVIAHLSAAIAASMAVAVPMEWALTRIGEAGMWANHVAAVPFELAFRAVKAVAPLVLLFLIMQGLAPGMTRRDGAGGAMVIGKEEVIQDSVFATGETVLVEGKVEGNVVMFGRVLEIRGEVDGDVVAGGQEVRITGRVNGSVFAGAETVSVRGVVTGSVFAGARNVHVETGGEVQHDIVSGSGTVTIDGTVGRGMTSGATSGVVAGTIGRGISYNGNELLVRSTGRVGGGIVAELATQTSLHIDQGASVPGKRDVSVHPQAESQGWGGIALWEIAVLAGAFVAGWLLLSVFPGFFGGAVQNVLSWRSAGLGFVALIVTPVAAIILCITLLGIPLGIATLMLYMSGLYLAKVVVGGYLGRELLGAKNGLPTLLGLLAGVALLQAVFWVPYGGGFLRFGVLCLGLGAMTLQMRQQVR